MGKLFSYDSGIIRTLNKIVDCVFLNFLWILFSIPIVTAGAATTALYYTANKVIRHDRSHVWREFWHAFKTNFKQSTVVWVLLLGVYWLLIANCLFFVKMIPNKPMLVFNIISICLVVIWMLQVFPHIARFENKLKAIMKNCALMGIRHILRSLLLLLLFAVAIVLLFMWPILIFVLPTLYMVIASFVLESMYEKYMSEEDLESEEERNRVFYN